MGFIDAQIVSNDGTSVAQQLEENTQDITRLDSITNTPVHIKDGFGADLSGATPSTQALKDAFLKGRTIQLPSVCTLVIDETFEFTTATTIRGNGRNSVIKLGANVTLFDIRTSACRFENLRVIVPDANTAPVFRMKPPEGVTHIKYTVFEDVYIETESVQGNWIGLQFDLSSGFLIYKNTFERLAMRYPKVGIQVTGGVVGQSGATGNYFRDLEILGFETGIDLQTNDSFQNNYFYGQLEDMRNNVDCTGVKMVSGWGNQFFINHWYDKTIGGRYINYDLGTGTHSNVIQGHMEGEYVDLGSNIFRAWYTKRDFTLVKDPTAGKFNDLLYNENPSPHNLLLNSDFTTGAMAGWTTSGALTVARDSVLLGRPVAKLTSQETTIRYIYQDLPVPNQYIGQYVHLGAWVRVGGTGGRGSAISIQDGIASTHSDLVPADGQWHWVTVSHKVRTGATVVRAELGRVNSALGLSATVGDIVYIANPIMTFNGRLKPQSFLPEKRLLKFTPSSNAELGRAGQTTYDDNYLYVWINDNQVRRVALSTW